MGRNRRNRKPCNEVLAEIKNDRIQKYQHKLEKSGYTVRTLTDDQVQDLISDDKSRWDKVIIDNNLELFRKSVSERLYTASDDDDGNTPTYTLFVNYNTLAYKLEDRFEVY